MSEVQCFLIEPSDRNGRWLRRYTAALTAGWNCASGYHQAAVRIEDGSRGEETPVASFKDDPRWPKKCEKCDREFIGEDTRQIFALALYKTPDGREVTLHESPPAGIESAPAGAMWLSDWCPGPKKHPGPFLWVMLPNRAGAWCLDGNSSGGGGGWTRTGTPPLVTANPSIHAVGQYHGWLRDGKLIEC